MPKYVYTMSPNKCKLSLRSIHEERGGPGLSAVFWRKGQGWWQTISVDLMFKKTDLDLGLYIEMVSISHHNQSEVSFFKHKVYRSLLPCKNG